MDLFTTVTLTLSGLLLSMIGLLRLSNPIKNYAKNSGIQLASDIDLLSEVRGVGALMLLGGLIILSGTILTPITISSLMVASLIFIGFAVGRLVSMSSDGKPNTQIITGLITELVLGTANVIVLAMKLMN